MTGVLVGRGWNCCAAKPARVVVFDGGEKWAACRGCASQYPGEVQGLIGQEVDGWHGQPGRIESITDGGCRIVWPAAEMPVPLFYSWADVATWHYKDYAEYES